MKRPRNLVYAVNERPPTVPLLVLGLQHAALSIVFLVYAAMVAKGAGFTLEQQQGMVVGTLLACGVGAILQGGFPRFSSGLLLIPLSSPMFVIFAIPAGKLAGPDGVAALTLVGGLVQILVGLTFRRLRAFFPPEVCGVVVLMLGVSMVPHAFERIINMPSAMTAVFSAPIAISLGISMVPHAFDKMMESAATGIYLPSVITGLVTLATIIACTIWLKGSKRFFAMLIGCAAGYATAAALGELGSFAQVVGQASMVDLPQLRLPSLSLEPSFLAGYAIVAMIAAVDNMGVIISTDRLDDAEWSRPDVGQISRGVSSLGATTIFSSLLGGTHLGLSSTNIGLAFATGVTSRVVGITAGLIMAGIAFFPAALAVVIAMPDPVLGGILAFAASYFIVAGAQLSLSRMMSPRRMLVVGLPIASGIAVLTTSKLGVGLTGIAAILIHSPLMSASIVAIVLNAVMRIGIAQKASITLVSGAGRHEQVEDALTEWGEMWGLKPATALSASSAMNQLLEAVADLAEGDIRLEARHDDVRLDLSVLYSGQPMAFPDRAPTADELMNEDDAMGRMAGWLVRNLADKATTFRRGDEQGVLLRFEG
jgi:xanthine/uracil permease